MQKGQLNIHSENILPIIKKWLYSERDIFIRELISNASDAISKRMVLVQRGESLGFIPKIEVRVDEKAKTITISDNGIGLDAPEAEKYLSQIAFSGAEEFVKTYQVQDAFIGHFGLGFYSAYMVSERVEVRSRSYKPEETGIVWNCDGSTEYSIADLPRAEVGTDIILHVHEEGQEYLNKAHLRSLIEKYCIFFPFPVYFEEALINPTPPIWIKSPSECTDADYKSFYSKLYPFEEPPLFWIHLNVDYPFHVKGVLFFPHVKEFSQSTSGVRLYSNRVFVSDDCSDILPEYLMMLKGVIDSPDIPLNVSRSYLQVDKTVRQLSTHITKKVADAIGQLYKNEREKYEAVWSDIERVLKIGSLQDEQFFSKVEDLLLWKNPEGKWVSAQEIRASSQEAEASCIYVHPNFASSSLMDSKVHASESLGTPVVISSSPLDAPLMMLYEKSKHPIHFKRIDAVDSDTLFDPERESTILDADGKTYGSKIADFFRKALETSLSNAGLSNSVQVEAKSLKNDSLPIVIQLDEKKRRIRDYLNNFQADQKHGLEVDQKMIINTNNPSVKTLYSLYQINPAKACDLAKTMVNLQKFIQGELPQQDTSALFTSFFVLLDQYASLMNEKDR